MKPQKINLIFVIKIFVLIKVVTISSDDVSNAITLAEKQVDQAEKEIIRAQMDFKDAVNRTLDFTKDTRNLLRNNSNLKKLSKPLVQLLNILNTMVKSQSFTLSNFQQKAGNNCSKIYVMIDELEVDMKLYLKSKKQSEETAALMTSPTEKLKLEYFATFIFFNKTQSEAVLSVIAMNEKLVDQNKDFMFILYKASSQIANALYDIKVVKYKTCEPLKKSESTKAPSKVTTKSKKVKNGLATTDAGVETSKRTTFLFH